MTLEQANNLVRLCAAKMNVRYGRIVFDEWAIISLAGYKARLLAYDGPRKTEFLKNFLTDAGSLRASLLNQNHYTGDFEFAQDGVGTGFEAFMALGQGMYLICNNTAQSMDGIAKDQLWLAAQVPFVDLSDRFRADSLA